MNARRLDFPDAERFERLHHFQDGAAGGDLVVEDERLLPLHLADDVMDLGVFRVVVPPFVKYGERQPEGDGVHARALGAARVGRDHHAVLDARLLVIIAEQFPGEQMVNRDPEKPRDLGRMQVHGHDAVCARRLKQVRNEPRGDGDARFVLLIGPGVGIIRQDRGDAVRLGVLDRIDHDEQFHDILVDRRA